MRARVGPVVSVRWGRSGGVRHVVKPLRGADARLSQLPPPPSTDAKYTHHCTHCIIICNTHTHTHVCLYNTYTYSVYSNNNVTTVQRKKKHTIFIIFAHCSWGSTLLRTNGWYWTKKTSVKNNYDFRRLFYYYYFFFLILRWPLFVIGRRRIFHTPRRQ